MEVSIFLAKVMGLYLVIICVAMLINMRPLNKVFKDFARDASAIFFSGMMALLLGLLVVVSHNVWVMGWPVIITIVGWLMILKGVLRILAPAKMIGWALKVYGTVMPVAIIVGLVAGVYLTYVGFKA